MKKKIILVVISLFSGIMISEIYLRVSIPSNLNRFYYKPLFKKNNQEKQYYMDRDMTFRNGRLKKAVSFKKEPNEKRVFIVGESVAEAFHPDLLQYKFDQELPNYKWNVINFGVAGSGSYKIKQSVNELINYKPDLVILMMGNNTYNRCNISKWIRHSRLIIYLMQLELFKEYFNRHLIFHESDIKEFRNNLNEIGNILSEKEVSLMVCTLPNNRLLPLGDNPEYSNKEFFSALWNIDKVPAKSEKLLKKIITTQNKNYYWHLAKALRNQNKNKESKEMIKKNYNIDRLNCMQEIIEFSEENDVILFDLKSYLEAFAPVGITGFEYFWDSGHFWPSAYDIIADEIVRKYVKYSGYKTAKTDILQINKEEKVDTNYDDIKEYLFYSLNSLGFNNEEAIKEIICWWYHFYPEGALSDLKAVHKRLNIYDIKSWVKVTNLVADVLREKKLYNEAIEILNWNIQYVPDNHMSYFYRGLYYYDISERKLADKDFNVLRKMNDRFKWLDTTFIDLLIDNQ